MGAHVYKRVGRRIGLCAGGCALSMLLVLTAMSAANVSVSKSGWQWANPLPQGRTLVNIAFAGNTGYAVGAGGTALSTANAGRSWSGLATGTTANLETVQALAPSTVVVEGGGGCVLRISEDGGLVFKRIFSVAESGCPEPISGYSFVSSRVGFLLLKNGAVEQTEDGGETFSRKTAIPGTPASSAPGTAVGAQIHFFSAASGIAFTSAAGNGPSAAFMTPDGGVSWVPISIPGNSHVTALYFVDEKTGYAVGPETLLRTSDGGEKWTAQPIASGKGFTSISCATSTRCVLTLGGGPELVETSDGGATDTVQTTSSSRIYGAAYASSKDIVAVGENGTTVVSSDGGVTFSPISSDIGGSFTRLREGPGAMLLAPGTHGDFAMSLNNGETWKVLATQTSQELRDVSFASAQVGYALDVAGGLQMTANGGVSWQTLSPGTSEHAAGVLALGEHTVLLIGPIGISRAVGGGAFEPLGARAVAKASLSDYDVSGSSVFAFGAGTHTLIYSGDEGAQWSAVKVPLARRASRHQHARAGVLIRSVAFTSAQHGMLLDGQGRLWMTNNRGRSWREVISTGTSAGEQLAFSTPLDGFLSVFEFGGDNRDAYVLRTSDGGSTWQPQEITAGSLEYGGLVSTTASNAAALIEGGESLHRLLFTTATGGELPAPAGAPALGMLTLSTRHSTLTARRLKAAHDTVRVTGTLTGAVGGETVVVARRDLAGGRWSEQRVIAGANGGSFSSSWHLTRSSIFVAQWAGGNGREGSGSKVLEVNVRR